MAEITPEGLRQIADEHAKLRFRDEAIPALRQAAERIEALKLERDAYRADARSADDAAAQAHEACNQLEARVEALEKGVRTIGRRSRSDGQGTFDDMIREMGWIDDECRRLLGGGK